MAIKPARQLTMSIQLSSVPASSARASNVALSQPEECLRRGLVRLSRRTQQVFLLSRLDGLSYTEIGLFLDVDVPAVEQAMIRALRQARLQSVNGPDAPEDSTREQAINWYVHLQSPNATASQRIEFRHWLDADLAHLCAFESTERLWRKLQAPATVMGTNGWHRRKRKNYILWCMATAFLCSLLVTAEAYALCSHC
jgi:hypothetical protein